MPSASCPANPYRQQATPQGGDEHEDENEYRPDFSLIIMTFTSTDRGIKVKDEEAFSAIAQAGSRRGAARACK